MCGIVGVIPLQSKSRKISDEMQRALAIWFHNEVLYHTVKRGKDATGLVATFGAHSDKENHPSPSFWACLKQPVETEEFFANDGSDKKYQGQGKNANIYKLIDKMHSVSRPLLHLVGHTRAKTVGTEFNPNNNHPIIIGNIIGVHNGGIKNVKKIYDKHNIKSTGDVDSEAVIQLLNEVAPDRPLTLDDAAYVTQRIEGPRAVIAFNSKHPDTLVFFRNHERPIEITYLDSLGLLVLHSETPFLKAALASYNRMRMVYGRSLDENCVLPATSETSAYLLPDEGGMVDVNIPFDAGTLKDYLAIKKLPDTLDEYKNVSTTTSVKTIGPSSSIVEGEVEIEDRSDYTSKGDDDTQSGTVKVSAAELMDDPAAGEADVVAQVTSGANETIVVGSQDDDSSSSSENTETSDVPEDPALSREEEEEEDEEPYDIDFLRAMAEAEYREPTFLDSKNIVHNRLKGKIAKLLNVVGMSENDAIDAMTMAYPEIFSDGYVYGYQRGQEDLYDQDNDEIESLRNKNEQLQADLALMKKKFRLATKHMANLKGFLLAASITKKHISLDKKTNKVHFDDEIEKVVSQNINFKDVNMEDIRKLFSDKEKSVISNGLYKGKLRSV
jgi:hypothetical protein